MMTHEENALTFLHQPDLLQCIKDDLTALGLVGEDDNKLLAYLVAASRKMDEPLAAKVRGESAAASHFLWKPH